MATIISPNRTHIDIYDNAERTALANRLGVTEDRLRKMVRLVGNRISTIEAHLRP